MNKKEKRNLVIRAFLAANKGEKYTPRQIANFMNESRIVDKYGFGGREMAMVMGRIWKGLRGVSREKKGGRFYYYWSGE